MSTTVEYDILIEVLDAVKDLKKLQTQSKKTKGGLDDTKKSGLTMASEIGAAFTGLKGAASTVTNAVAKIAGVFVDAAQASFELSRSVVDNINDLNDLSARSSISAQTIESLKLAFESSGQSADTAKTIISQFPRALTAIKKEGSQANQVLKSLGVDPAKLKNGNEAFLESIRALEGIEDQTMKAQAANVIFGRSAGDLLQALGAGEFDEFTASIERYGTKAGPEASEQAAEFQKRLALIAVIADRASQAFVQNTGMLDFFIRALGFAQQALAGLNAFLQAGQSGLKALAGDIVGFGIKTFEMLANKVTSFVAGPWLGMLKAFDALQQKITGKSLFGEAIKEIGLFIADQYELTDAIQLGAAAFDREGEAIALDQAAKVKNNETTEESKKLLKELANALGKTTKATDKDTDAKKANTKAEKARAKAEKERRKLITDSLKRMIQAQKSIASIQSDANADLLSDLDKINQLEKERLAQLKRITAQQKISTEEAQKAVKARAQRERGALAQQQAAGGIGQIGGVISAASSPQGLLDFAGSLAGPVGSAVASALGGLAALGDTSGIDEELIAKKMEETGKNRDAAIKQILIDDKAAEFQVFFKAIVMGLQVLPSILIKSLPAILLEAAYTITAELARLPFTMLGVIIEAVGFGVMAIGEFLSDLTPAKLGQAILDALKGLFDFFFGPIVDALSSIFGGDSKMGGGRFLSAQGGLRFTGRDQGLAMLHAGEMVVPRSGQMSSSVARDVEAQAGGGGVTININSAITERSAVDALVRKIEQRFGDFGQSTSPLFGGI
ncbi:MAG: hypothetical protein Unbinned5179contig1004_23 [Prokaryotic dsDNA virus sp.]|nr:MAG: hypothetical protein Unbinned5179contig1004_23 [Prokaryotic dsDNA virus sp.]